MEHPGKTGLSEFTTTYFFGLDAQYIYGRKSWDTNSNVEFLRNFLYVHTRVLTSYLEETIYGQKDLGVFGSPSSFATPKIRRATPQEAAAYWFSKKLMATIGFSHVRSRHTCAIHFLRRELGVATARCGMLWVESKQAPSSLMCYSFCQHIS
jgi:hypothetical protein